VLITRGPGALALAGWLQCGFRDLPRRNILEAAMTLALGCRLRLDPITAWPLHIVGREQAPPSPYKGD
jgi:hypothetical protein